ncbi:hypothetical protein JIN77_15010 [Verrucomicrobiaceae bacterium R5-34]|nr:hypothetical protein [Verrucomicrobiaceae bacterium R5-34]
MELDGQVIVLILFVVISGIQWLIKKIQGKGQEDEVNESLEDIYDDFREEIRRRQTEVAGPPAPPPLPGSQPPPQPRPVVAVERAAPAAVPQQAIAIAPQTFKIKKPELSEEEKAAAERFQELLKSPGKRRRKRSAAGHITARELLSNPESARQAVILHEVFGPPKSSTPGY